MSGGCGVGGRPAPAEFDTPDDAPVQCGRIAEAGGTVRRDLMEILACPVCKGELELTVDEEDEREVIRGSLRCAKCDERYPITDTIPNLLPPELRN